MVSKNNKDLYIQKSANRASKYTIKKLSIGVTSVLVGTTFFLGSATGASASEQITEQQTAIVKSADQTSTDADQQSLKNEAEASTSTESSTTDATKASDVTETSTDAQTETAAETSSTSTKSSTDDTSSAEGSSASKENENTQVDNNTQDNTDVEKESTTESTLSTNDEAKSAVSQVNTANTVESNAQTEENKEATPVATFRAATVTENDSTSTTVNNWTGLINALNNSRYQTINVDGTISARGTGTVYGNNRSVVIKGANQNSGINFGSTPLVANGNWNLTFENLNLTTTSADGTVTFGNTYGTSTVTYKDVRHSGASLYGGSGNANVVIDGTTTSTVSSASKPTVNTYKKNGNDANIWGAKSVTVANGANFTLNRSAIGDGINLPDGSTVRVGDNATMTVNMNTNNATDSARYHDAGIFMLNGGNFLTGRNSTVNMNTSIGQAVSIGADRPAIGITDSDRFGGYGARSRNDGPTAVTFGEYSTFNFAGRDGLILGNNANFTSGEYSNVHFQNNGRGVALDLANNSNIVISKHSNTLFESKGKTGTSGSYDGYNYIGVNEGGNITIDEYATFRVILTGRGDNPWDDVISLDSQNANTAAAFTSKKGAVVDIRDDNTNFYAELISFPLGAAKSVIDIQDPLYLNLERFSNGGAVTGWMPVGGLNIKDTGPKFNANLVYMAGTKGTFRVSGTDYVVYQKVKRGDNKQPADLIWLNINSANFDKDGFRSRNKYDNGVNPDLSISGIGLTAGVAANNIYEQGDVSPDVQRGNNGVAPYYGLSTMRASHQIWFPHTTETQAAGQHQNVIKYVYEDGTEAAPTVTQTVDLTRDITLDLTPEQIKSVKEYGATHTADQILDYIKNLYIVSKDSGWQVANGVNTKTAYDAVATPELAGYTASIQSTNANGVKVGGDASSIHATLDMPNDSVVENGQLSEAYKNNGGVAVMPANYETVVVYKKVVQNQPVTIIYQDKTENNKVLDTDKLEGKPGTDLNYSTATKIENFINKGYKLVSDGVPTNATFGDEPMTYYVTLEHDIAPVGPNDPHEPDTPINPNDPDGPKWPAKDQYSKDYTSTITYVDEQGNKVASDNVQTSTWTRTLQIDKVTGEIQNPNEAWTADKSRYDAVKSPVVEGYYADKAMVNAKDTVQENLTEQVVYRPLGKIIPVDPNGNPIPDAPTPQYPNDPTDPSKTVPDQPVPEIPGMTPEVPSVTPEDPGKDTKVVYNYDDQKATINYIDETTGQQLASDNVSGKSNAKIEYSTAAKIKDLTDKGYVLVSDGFPVDAMFDNDKNKDQVFEVILKHGEKPVGPNDPHEPDTPINPNDPDGPKWPAKDQYSKDYTSTITYVDEQGNKVADDNVQTSTWTRTLIIDTVTGEVKNPNEAWTADKSQYDAVKSPVVEGYYADKAVVNAKDTVQENLTEQVVYRPLGKIVPVDPEGNPIPNVPNPQYPNDPTDPSKTVPDQPVPEIPGYQPEVPSVTPDKPGEDTPVIYVPVVEDKYSLLERFVDEEGNEVSATVVKGTDYKEGTEYDVTGDAKVINGYYLKATSDNAKGTFGKDNVTVTFTYAKLGKIIPVDPNGNPIPDAPNPQYPNDPTDPSKTVPDQPVPEIPGMTPEVPSVTPEDPGKDTEVVYNYDDQKATINYIDETTGQQLASDNVSGKSNAKIEYSTAAKIKELTDKGYVLVSDGFPADAMFDNDKNKDQVFEVILKHGEKPVGPNDPHEPNTPINPNDPDGPKWPAKDQYSKDYTSTITYVDEQGNKVADDNVQTSTWTRTLIIDTVTGEVKNPNEAWTADKSQYDAVKSPVVEGYYADKAVVNAKDTVQENLTEQVVYRPLGKVIPVDPEGNPIPNVPNPQYPNDPNDPTKGGTTPVPEIPGYQPEVPSVTPDKPGEDTPVIYVPVVEDKYSLLERFVDEEGNEVSATVVKGTDYKEGTEYDVTGDAKVINGYYLKATSDNAKGIFGKDNVTVTFTYAKLGKIVPVDPNGNPIPDAPTPQYPNDPTDPSKTVPNQPVPEIPGYRPEVPTVTPDKPGEDTPVIYVPVVEDKYSLTERFVDEEGNEVSASVTKGTDYKEGTEYDVTGDAKVIDGYYLIKTSDNAKGTFGKDNVTVTFTYAKLGKIIPVDPNGNPIPDAPTPQYPNDPTDPSKTVPDQPVPEIPGMTPEVPSVTPEDPGKDTKVVYNYDDQKATINYIDETTGQQLASDNVSGKSNAKIEYSTAAKIKDLTDKGYVLVSDGFPVDAMFDNDKNKDQVFEVILKHGEKPVGPNDPHEPDTPINPNDPDGPKWPAKDQYSKDYTSTITYVDEQGNKVADDNVQTSTWTRTLIIDTVTGEVKNPNEAWTADKSQYDAVKSPVVEGYYADKAVVNAKDTVQENLTEQVVYRPLGKVIPVDPEGNPIPNVPNPQYPNDPNDPTKGGTTPVPEIPGYQPEVPSVTPDKPCEDTPVIYVPVVEDKYSLLERFVDEEGNEVSATVVKGTDYKEGTEYDVTGDAKVINGYYLKATSDNAKGKFGKDNVTVTFTYAKLGKIVPVDPNGQPIPDAPTPQYPNDPTDPSKTVPDQPVPEIPGYRPEVPTVTPDKPGEDTPVIYVPVVEDKYSLTERFVDEEGNEVSASVTKGTDYKEGTEYDVTGDAKVIDGYYLKATSDNAKGTFGKDNVTVTFTYAKLGKIVPVDPNGQPIPDAPTPQYPNDPTDPSKTVPDQPVPEIPGYRPEVPTVTPDKPGEDTPVIYVPVVEDKYSLTERFVDEEGNEVSASVTKGTEYKEGTEYDVTGDAKVIDGYYLKATSDNAKGTFGKDNVTVTFTYAKLGKIVPVDPNGKPIPDAPTPQYPNDPTDPSKTVPDQPVPEIPGYRPEVPTVTPDKPGEDTPVIYVPVVEDKYSLTERFVDEEGNELSASVTKGTDYKEGTEYDVTGDAKVIDGYYLKVTSDNAKGTFGKDNVTVTFTYAKLGKIIPVDPNGKPIPDAPTPQYPNDPTDPSKTVPDQPVPEIPGYRPEVPTVTPDKPGEDTPVIYVPVTPEKHVQTAKIVYVDTKTGKTLETDTVTGGSGDKIDYSTTPRIDELINKGYVLVEDGFTNAGTPVYDDNDDEDQVFVVKLDHGTAPVGPNDPHEPGTPINPNDPNGPKWPAKDGYTKQYTSTVHFVDENGNQLYDDDVQTSTWTRTLIIDKVTGEVLNPNENWNSDIDSYADVKAPVIEGYYADRANVPGQEAQQQDIENTVTYRPIGKIIPVDPNGNPIPNVPTPQYRNDPNDPTKVIVTNTPDVPGMVPETTSVTPSEPGVDTPVVYHVVEQPAQPTPKAPETPKAPNATPVNNIQTPIEETPATSEVTETKANELPQTGDKQNNTLAAVGASIVAGLLGLIGFAKKKDDEKEI
ncbi:mucin-binding protein [Ligilactobacillus faecis]|uniref:mucin-binding protein n=1 Tax=Ligilactobacillus faecis TaxID=762833 RepID=UPI002468DF2F|nr:MucBP domain-containing protein [Ligilactobacillus faecis]WGN90531.1 MucBP domain-containing protein [Ligilactobacillus faecis]